MKLTNGKGHNMITTERLFIRNLMEEDKSLIFKLYRCKSDFEEDFESDFSKFPVIKLYNFR